MYSLQLHSSAVVVNEVFQHLQRLTLNTPVIRNKIYGTETPGTFSESHKAGDMNNVTAGSVCFLYEFRNESKLLAVLPAEWSWSRLKSCQRSLKSFKRHSAGINMHIPHPAASKRDEVQGSDISRLSLYIVFPIHPAHLILIPLCLFQSSSLLVPIFNFRDW